MPTTATAVKRESLLRGSLFIRITSVTTNDGGGTSNDSRSIHCPLYVKQPVSTDTEGGIFILDVDGITLAKFEFDGRLQIRGISRLETSIAGTANGVYFKDAAGDYVAWIDGEGNLGTLEYSVGMDSVALEENVAGIGAFPDMRKDRIVGPAPRAIFTIASDLTTIPLLQVLNSAGSVVTKVSQDGSISFLDSGGLFAGYGDAALRTIRGSI